MLPWDGLGTCPVLYAKSAKTGTASCDYLMTVTRCWWKKCFSEEWKSTESSICSPHAVLQLILSSAVQIHKALTKYCSLRSARHLIIFLLNWASLFWWSLSTWFHIFVPPCSVRMSSHHTWGGQNTMLKKLLYCTYRQKFTKTRLSHCVLPWNWWYVAFVFWLQVTLAKIMVLWADGIFRSIYPLWFGNKQINTVAETCRWKSFQLTQQLEEGHLDATSDIIASN